MPRPRHRRPSHEFLFFDRDHTRGWRVIRPISFERGESMVDLGTAVRVIDVMGKHLGYKLASTEGRRISVSVQTATCISAGEMQAAVGLFGRSATKHMSEDRRYSRKDRRSGKPLPAEDFVERSEAKAALYDVIFDAKAPLAIGRYV